MSRDVAHEKLVSKLQPHEQAARTARQAIRARDWRTAEKFSKQILQRDRDSAEGLFLSGMIAQGTGRTDEAVKRFARVLRRDPKRYDAVVELAKQYANMLRYGDAYDILEAHVFRIGDSPLYLDRAASVYSRIGMWNQAWPLLERADQLQPDVPVILANKAQCAVSIGKIGVARSIYQRLLRQHPGHQRNHYQLSRLETAQDDQHIQQMQQVLDTNGLAPRGNIFLYYALGKELEDLERWDESFRNYQLAGDAAAAAANHDVRRELDVVETIIDVCDKEWLRFQPQSEQFDKSPIFIVGLPRTGTTLVERIISSHSRVESIGETLAFEKILSGAKGQVGDIGVDAIRNAANQNTGRMAGDYLRAVDYMLGEQQMFIEKYTYNYLYLGFIAKAFPDAKIIHLQRNPMDACFAMFKQPFFSFAMTLDDLARYYPAYDRLMQHWRSLLGDRLIEISYEVLVQDPENETRQILAMLGLEFESACLDFDKNMSPSATASSVQVREKMHIRSVGKWRHFERHLEPLARQLADAGIDVS